MLVVFFTLITSVFVIQFNTTRDFLREQQTTEMDNAISAVGLALSPYLVANDMVSVESVLHATFDSSFYREIHFSAIREDIEIHRQYPNDVAGVPSWFQSLIEIEPITRTTTLSANWLQLANLKLVSSTAHAYQKLWQSTLHLILGFSITFVIGMAILSLILSKVLKPLNAIQKGAQQMSANIFGRPLEVPKIRELADVVNAFNHMTAQLDIHFRQQAQEADKLRVRAFQDPVSGLANRSYLLSQLDAWLSQRNIGGIALLKVDIIADSYENLGYEEGDLLVQQLSTRLSQLATEEYTLSRLSKAEFMIIAPSTTAEELLVLGRILLVMSSELQVDPLNIGPSAGAVGLVMRSEEDNVSSLLAQADNALTQAKQQPKERLVMFDRSKDLRTEQETFGKQQWKALVDEAIANQLFKFKFQKAIDQNNEVIHQEVFAYIQKGDVRYTASQFIGAIEQLDAGSEMDMFIIEKLIKQLDEQIITGKISVNITESSVNDTSFIRWLTNKMQSFNSVKDRIIFEIPEICFIKHTSNTEILCETIHREGFQFGIDNFGHNFSSMGYLNKFRPAHIKLDFAYTHRLNEEMKLDALSSITQTANNLSITAIATRVESKRQKDKL
ncbi:EAL domain-containing protein, partial [Photobacterium sp. BZF1]|nr:EAL domain-containing protein [Photobacterium sp. BZF1]